MDSSNNLRSSSNSSTFDIDNIMYVMPCTNESQGKGIVQKALVSFTGRTIGVANENKEGIFSTKDGKVNITSGNCSSKDVCKTEKVECSKPLKRLGEDEDDTLLKYLPYTFGDPVADNSCSIKPKSCENINNETFWEETIKHLNNICFDKETKETSVIMVTHNHRLQELILPEESNESNKTSKKLGYANCFCIKLSKPKEESESESIEAKVSGEIIHLGYPDNKNKYDYVGTTSVGLDKIKLPKLKNLHENITLYIVRHGNAMHNKPFKILKNNLDSSLTPLGIYQAYLLGIDLQKEINKGVSIKLVCSYLHRSQHTALSILNGLLHNDNNIDKIAYKSNLGGIDDLKTFGIWYDAFTKFSMSRIQDKNLTDLKLEIGNSEEEKKYKFQGFLNTIIKTRHIPTLIYYTQSVETNVGGSYKNKRKTRKKQKKRKKTSLKKNKRKKSSQKNKKNKNNK